MGARHTRNGACTPALRSAAVVGRLPRSLGGKYIGCRRHQFHAKDGLSGIPGKPASGRTLEYSVTIEDLTTWTRPWTVKMELSKQSDQANRTYKEPRCHEGNFGLPALLLGARAEEHAFAAGRGPDPATLCSAGCGGFAAGFADSGEDSNPLNR